MRSIMRIPRSLQNYRKCAVKRWRTFGDIADKRLQVPFNVENLSADASKNSVIK